MVYYESKVETINICAYVSLSVFIPSLVSSSITTLKELETRHITIYVLAT